MKMISIVGARHQFIKELEIKEPDYNLGVGPGGHGVHTGEMLRKIEELFTKEKEGASERILNTLRCLRIVMSKDKSLKTERIQ